LAQKIAAAKKRGRGGFLPVRAEILAQNGFALRLITATIVAAGFG